MNLKTTYMLIIVALVSILVINGLQKHYITSNDSKFEQVNMQVLGDIQNALRRYLLLQYYRHNRRAIKSFEQMSHSITFSTIITRPYLMYKLYYNRRVIEKDYELLDILVEMLMPANDRYSLKRLNKVVVYSLPQLLLQFTGQSINELYVL